MLNSEVAVTSLFCQIQHPNFFLLELKTITRSPGNGTATVFTQNNHKNVQEIHEIPHQSTDYAPKKKSPPFDFSRRTLIGTKSMHDLFCLLEKYCL